MKVFKVSVFIVALIILASCEQKPTKRGYKLVWEENFKDSTKLEENWSKIPRGKSDWNNYMSDNNSLYAIEDGKLVLRGIKNTVDTNDEVPYLTGGIYTKGKKAFSNGRLEIKARLYNARSAWPAIWLLPEGEDDWPNGGEIDIMERLNADPYVYQTIHTSYTLEKERERDRMTDEEKEEMGPSTDPKSGIVAHVNLGKPVVYAVELYNDSVNLFVNDTKTFSYPRMEDDIPGQFPFGDNDYYLLIDMQLGGSWVGEVNEQDLPAKMEVEWVRFFERVEVEEEQ